MSRFYITGGTQRKGANAETEWFSYAEAIILELDTEDNSLRRVASYVTPPENRPDEENCNIVFKAGTIHDGKFHICTQTEIVSYSLPEMKLSSVVSHPWFNDMHHVTVNERGNFLVANTGLDMVAEVSPDGEALREYPVLDEDIWERFDRDRDYRKVLTTKPHLAHPNYVFEYDGEIWASRLIQKDAVCVTAAGRTIGPMVSMVHDGNIEGDDIYFTSVNGHVSIAELATGNVKSVYDLSALSNSDKTLGWCRGLHVLDRDRVLVGFSRLRPSKFKENLSWVKHRMGLHDNAGRMPTRVACYNLTDSVLEWEVDLEPDGMNAVFSILPAGSSHGSRG